MIRDVLTYSKLSREEMRQVYLDLDKLVPDLIAQFPEFQAPKAKIQIQSPLLPVLGHEACLGQCLTNLLSNAVKFVPRGTKPRIKLWTEWHEGKVSIFVEDNGIGIEPASLNRIFGIFERINSRDRYEGTGIGLAIVRKGIERLGGQVGVDSRPGRGSRFWIQLNPGIHEQNHPAG